MAMNELMDWIYDNEWINGLNIYNEWINCMYIYIKNFELPRELVAMV